MKRKNILTLALSALLLAGCSKENDLINNLDMSETVSDSLTQATEAEEDTQFIIGGETQTEAAESDAPPEIETEYPADGVSYKILDYSRLNPDGGDNGRPYGNQFYKDNIFCITYMMSPPEDYPGDMKLQMRFYDTAENKFLASVDIPTGWNISEKLAETDSDMLCRYALTRYFYDEVGNATGKEQAVLTVRRDFSSDIAEGYTAKDCSVEMCGHNIADWERNIIDTDSGEILVGGYYGTSEYDLSVTSKRYRFPIDENRFVYSTIGYESIPGFGVYDFSTDTASDVPGSRDLVPLGVHDGRIYSLQSEWDSLGHDTALYVTDIETLETELFMEAPVYLELNDYADYEMTESGSVIVMGYYPDDETVSPQLYLIDPDTKEFTVCDIPGEFRDYGFSRTNGNAFIMSNWKDKALIFEINI